MTANNSAFNEGQLAPSPPFPERVGNVFERVEAVPNPHRSGERQFEEGFERRGAFLDGMASSRARRGDLVERPRGVYEVQPAGQEFRRTEPGASNPSPAWSRTPAILDEMFFGASGDQGDAVPFQHSARAGANPNTISPLGGLDLGERRGTIYARSVGYNPRRPNEADVSGR